ncbi:MAG: sigma-70 family RNA polymerase sigma factor [Candidatus Riflebacteria bacterium]|nr:sigma-70 family RNA polymerase sigma factor [Candidatus Riflebacteria bacterium]
MEENEILTVYKKNPEKGFEMLYLKFAGKLVFFARNSFGLSEGDAEDIVHDALLPWAENPEKMASVQKLSSYLFSSVRNGAIRFHKARKADPLPDEMPASVENLLDRETTILVKEALKKLPEEQRETLVLRVWGDLPIDDVATIHEVPVQTVASRYRYGIQKLKELLKWME